MAVAGIELLNFSLRFCNEPLFEGLNAHFAAGQWHSLLGRSGVGKSSLIKAIAGLLQGYEQSGEIRADDGQPLLGRIAWMAQDDLLLPWLTVEQNIQLGPRLRREQSTASQTRALELLALVGLSGMAQRMPAQLSGGQRQRVALARTLMEDKPIVLIDEPFSALDVSTRLQIQDLFVELLKDKTVLLITHDPMEALRLSQQVWLMQGDPVRLQTELSLSSTTPRALDDGELIHWQSHLLRLLMSPTDTIEQKSAAIAIEQGTGARL